MSNVSRDEFLDELGRLYERDATTACHLRTAPIENNVADLDQRKKLWHELQEEGGKLGLKLGATSCALFLLSPVPQLQALVDQAKASLNGKIAAHSISTTYASSVIRSFLAKGGHDSGTPRSSAPASPAKAGLATSAGATSLPAVSSPLKNAVMSSDDGPTPGSSIQPKRKASASPQHDESAKKSKTGDRQTPPPPSSPAPAVESPATAAKRKGSATMAAYRRDRNVCIISGYAYPDGAHVIPFSGNTEDEVRRLMLALLETFWGVEATSVWRAQCEDAGVTESSQNIVCLSKHLHGLWGYARFALKPLRDPRAAEKNEVWVQLHWLRQGLWKPEDMVSPDTADQHMDALAGRTGDAEATHGFAMSGSDGDSGDRGRNGTLAHRESGIPVQTGQVFVIRADDPKDLPSLDLFELQWNLVRLAAMAGAAGIFASSTNNNDDTDDAAAACSYNWETDEIGFPSADEEEFDGDVEPLDLEKADMSHPF